MLFVLGLFFKRILPLALLAAIVGGGIWAWREAHASVPSSLPAALDDVRSVTTAPARQVLPLTGVYHYSTTGQEVLSVGPLEITRTLPDETLLVVLPEARGVRQLDWRYARDSAETLRLVSQGGGSNVVYRSATVGVRGFSRDYGGKTVSAQWRPKRPKAGLKWNATYQAGSDLAFRRESQVLRQETLTVGDQRVRTWVIQTREILIGSVDGEERETVWWSQELNLDVKRQLQRKVGGTVSQNLTATFVLQSIAPQR
jgi:hypothetical protein